MSVFVSCRANVDSLEGLEASYVGVPEWHEVSLPLSQVLPLIWIKIQKTLNVRALTWIENMVPLPLKIF